MQPIHWYPGHMAKAKRLIDENLKLVDVVVILLDARAPMATMNADIEKLAANKAQLWVLNKADMADPALTKAWLAYLQRDGRQACALDSRTNAAKTIAPRIRAVVQDKIDRAAAKGVRRGVRAMITGIPNVGKSTLINSLSGGAHTKTGDKPGVTKSKQWIRVDEYMEVMDTPGLLWPRQDDAQVSLHLAYIAAIRDGLVDSAELSQALLLEIAQRWPGALKTRYKLDDLPPDDTGEALLAAICRKRGCLLPGGVLDVERGAMMVMEDFRSKRLGAITLEVPPQKNSPPQHENPPQQQSQPQEIPSQSEKGDSHDTH